MANSIATSDPIRHVVQLILENRSFDQMLGCLKQVYADLDGVDPEYPRVLLDDGREVAQAPMTVRQMLKWDPHHEVQHVAIQMAGGNMGFVRDFATAYPDSTADARKFIMGYYPLDFLPALHTLARNFTICDRWFSSLPGPTWPNRFFALSGTSNGRVNMPSDGTHTVDGAGYFQQNQTTLFDRLNDKAIHWKTYFHDIPQSSVLNNQRQPHNAARYFYIDQFYADACGSEKDFPQYCLIEPDYMGTGLNDGHPPHDIMRSEKLIADVYNALRANDTLWQSTLLIVMFDEHGGFYDHVEPPPAVAPDDALPSEYSFTQLGLRVPAILVSPWTRGRVEHSQFDHTSVLRYLSDKWELGPLGRRTASALSIGVALGQAEPRADTPSRILLTPEQLLPPDPKAEELAFGILNGHQKALRIFTQKLEEEMFEGIARPWPWIARLAEAVRKGAEALLRHGLQLPARFTAAIAEPDKLATPLDVGPRDTVARFMMRMKQYAAQGLETRLSTPELSPALQQHSLQTLSLISGRDFHQAPTDVATKVEVAKRWLQTQRSQPRINSS